MGVLSRDTTTEAEAAVIRLTRTQTPGQKIAQVAAMIQTGREFALAGLRARYPSASPGELQRRLAALVLDRDIVRRVYGWDPAKEGY